ncbi:MAG: isoprenoid biosynthesis protein ElbB [Planctomycetes bacterium]|nr:isoprenoid biosynthesis protein ElbB [Planctomycetota bacterium]NOG53877.1 isoprenoid biosynthesis glyoxalase ElbB [Planctomycetota bacterium]
MAKVLVVLSGCGVSDGTEIHEAVSTLIHLDRHEAQYTMSAPDRPQTRVYDHAKGEVASKANRNVLTESARIARGEIMPLHQANGADFDAVIFPGGFGAALNLCTFASDGANCSVDEDVRRVILEARQAGKVIAFICIAPAIAAAVLGNDYHPKLTIGNDKNTAAGLEALGAVHVDTPTTAICVDEENRIVSTPAYMCATRPSEVYEGIGTLVDKVLAMCG